MFDNSNYLWRLEQERMQGGERHWKSKGPWQWLPGANRITIMEKLGFFLDLKGCAQRKRSRKPWTHHGGHAWKTRRLSSRVTGPFMSRGPRKHAAEG